MDIKWNDQELLEALMVYRKIKKNGERLDAANPILNQLAQKIGRTIGSVVMRMQNFRYLDTDSKSGLKNGGKNLRIFWDRHISFIDN